MGNWALHLLYRFLTLGDGSVIDNFLYPMWAERRAVPVGADSARDHMCPGPRFLPEARTFLSSPGLT